MRRSTWWARAYMPRLRKRRTERRLHSEALRRERRAASAIGPVARKRRHGSRIRIFAPEELDLLSPEHRRQTIKFCAGIAHHCVQKSRLLIDLSRVTRLRPGGTLLFAATIDRALRDSPRGTLQATRPQHAIVSQVIEHLGLTPKLGLAKKHDPEQYAENVKHWRFATGVKAEGARAGPLLEHYEGRLAQGLEKSLYRGISEAMDNCLYHAYEGRPASEERRWWLFSQERDGELHVAFCDLGIGIPKSLTGSEHWAKNEITASLKRLVGATPHAEKIKLATTLHSTRTNELHRGKGLKDIIDVIRRSKTGHLRILSDKGSYYINASGNERLADIAGRVGGTVLEWTIPLQKDSAHGEDNQHS